MHYLGHTYAKRLFVVYPKVTFSWCPAFYSADISSVSLPNASFWLRPQCHPPPPPTPVSRCRLAIATVFFFFCCF